MNGIKTVKLDPVLPTSIINKTMPVWYYQLPFYIIGFKKYLTVLDDSHHLFQPFHPILLPQPVLENPVYKVEDVGGTSWKMTILNIRSLASLATKNYFV